MPHIKNIFHHQTKREELIKFFLLAFVVLGYFLFLSWKYDLATGGLVSAITWSFFVLCTPIADAGFLIDFPVRLITGIRMIFTELFVWVLAILINVIALIYTPQSYNTTFLTSLFHKILTTPYPYWSIILLCSVGTFLSIRFGDEMLDVVKHKERAYHHRHGFKHKLIVMAALIIIIVWSYYHLINKLGVTLP